MKKYLTEIFSLLSEKLEYLKTISINFNVPNINSHGDLSTNAAMLLTKQLKRNPREIATEIV